MRHSAWVDRTTSSPLLWLGCALVGLSVLLRWLITPLQGSLRGYAVPFMQAVPLSTALHNPVSWRSFGGLLGILLVSGILLHVCRLHVRVLFYLGVLLFLGSLCFVGNIVCTNAGIYEALLEQSLQGQYLSTFSAEHLNGSAQYLDFHKALTADSLFHKAQGSLQFIGMGWYAALAGALCVIRAGYQQCPPTRRWDVLVALLMVCLLSTGLAGPTLKAEYDRIQGDLFLAQGDLQSAVARYASAVSWDSNLAANTRYTFHLGAAYHRLGWTDRAEARLYLGDNYLAMKAFPEAIRAYEAAVAQRAGFPLARRKYVEALVTIGLEEYAAGKQYTAHAHWQRVLDIDPKRFEVHFFLAKSYLDIHTQQQGLALREAQEALTRTTNKLVRADLYNMLGDLYYKQREFVTAREMYTLSQGQYQLVKKIINFGAMKGLQGL